MPCREPGFPAENAIVSHHCCGSAFIQWGEKQLTLQGEMYPLQYTFWASGERFGLKGELAWTVSLWENGNI